MEPITTVILATVTAGATAGIKDAMQAAIVDAYSKLKDKFSRILEGNHNILQTIAQIETHLNHKGPQGMLEDAVNDLSDDIKQQLQDATETLAIAFKNQSKKTSISQNIHGDHNVGIVGDNNSVTNNPSTT